MYIIFCISCKNNRIYQQEYRDILELIMEGADTLADIQRISCKSMQNDAEELEAILKRIPKIIEQLQVSMRKLSSCWNGPAWENFQHQVNKDIQNMNELYENLTELQKALSDGRDVYLKTEFNNFKAIKSILI